MSLHANRIRELASAIEKIDPLSKKGSKKPVFDMSNYSTSCGSPLCMAGWACHIFKKELKSEHKIILNGFVDFFEAAQLVLGLTDEQAFDLFLPTTRLAGYDVLDKDDPRYITPERAADTLRYLAETETVDWGDDD